MEFISFCVQLVRRQLSVFEEFKVTREAITVIRGDMFSKARVLAIELPCTDLCGVDKGSLMLTAGITKYGMALPEARSIQRSTLFVCALGAPIVDFFIHDANGVQVLLQVAHIRYV